MKANPPLAPWNPENLGLIAYLLTSGVTILFVTVGQADAWDVGYGVVFVALGTVGLMHALWSRHCWSVAGRGPLPEQTKKVTRFVHKYKPVLLWGGWGYVLLLALLGRLNPKEPKDLVMPLVMGGLAISGTASHIAWHRARRWLALQEVPENGHPPAEKKDTDSTS